MKAELLENLKEEIHAACAEAGRKPADVTLVAVSKTKPWQDVTEFLALGQKDFGENYVQEALAKIEAVGAGPRWHFVGNLQSNKAKFIPGAFHLFHALDSFSLAQKLNRAAEEKGVVQECLVEVNVDDESTKGGLTGSQLETELTRMAGLAHLRVRGLMCIPAAEKPSRAPFAHLRELLERVNRAGAYPQMLTELSMGMSNDFREAILEGATFVRVGTRLFGERAKK